MDSPSHGILSVRSRLSQEDALLLQLYGRGIMEDMVSFVVESILFGAYGILFGIAVYSILRKGIKSRGSIIMLLVVCYLYASSVVQWALDLTRDLGAQHALLMVPHVPIRFRGDLADAWTSRFVPAAEALFDFNMIIGDGVVVWRTWAVYQGRILAIAMPCVLLLISFVFGLIDITCNSYNGPLPGRDNICFKGAQIAWAFSVATNVTCTILIAVKAWQHRRMFRELDMGRQRRKMSTEHILSLLVESGFIYSLLWLTQIIVYLDIPRTSPWFFVLECVQVSVHVLAGMYPTIIIVIVNFQRTIWEESSFTINSGPVVSNSLPWSVAKGAGPTDTINTQSEADVHFKTINCGHFRDPEVV